MYSVLSATHRDRAPSTHPHTHLGIWESGHWARAPPPEIPPVCIAAALHCCLPLSAAVCYSTAPIIRALSPQLASTSQRLLGFQASTCHHPSIQLDTTDTPILGLDHHTAFITQFL